jgi:outer membrane cobalamin receptor
MAGYLLRFGARAAVVTAVLAMPDHVAAQDATPPAPASESAASPPPSAPVTEIVVTGERAAVETTIDRKIYAVSRDLVATAGTAADVLRNVPSVSVDVDGNPSLRGDASVTILIDGRLAPEFNNASRGQALQQLGAENIDRIEVLTNPPANYKRDGSGGIINIITKRRPGTRSASAQASLGSHGRYNLGGRAGRQVGKANLRASASVRSDPRQRDFQDQRTTFDGNGNILEDRQTHTVGEDERLSKNLGLGADFDITDTDRLTADGTYTRRDAEGFQSENGQAFDADGDPTGQYTRERRGEPYEYSSSAQLRYHRRGEKDGDGLTVNAERSQSFEKGLLHFTNRYVVPTAAGTTQDKGFLEDHVAKEFSVDYVLTQAGDRKLVAGYNLSNDDFLFDALQTFTVPAGGTMPPDPDYSNVFRYTQTIHALYGSWELPFEQWTWLAGVRLEDTRLDIDQVTTGQQFTQNYFKVYPSLHVSRELTEQQKLRFSFSHRVFRPGGTDLNPFRIQNNEFSVSEGNPYLEPIDTDLVEAGWSFDRGRTSRSVTAYARRSKNARTNVTTVLSPTVTLTRPENVGGQLTGGLELGAAGRIGESFDYNLSGNLYYLEMDASNLGFENKRSTYSADAKAALTWRMGDKDTLQINAALSGRRVMAQGYRPSTSSMDLGYRHQFRQNLSMTATVTDVFASRKFAFITDTPELQQSTTFRPAGRIVFLGLSWTMAGAKKPAQEKFEYEQ